VQTREAFAAALEPGDVDLILSDSSLPAFEGTAALQMARAKWPNIPFIFVSGTLPEAQAQASIQSGATDFVPKNHLTRLIPAVRRVMQAAEDRAERSRAETRFMEAQKMEVAGHLASGVAHDFNNILAIIMGHSHLMIQKWGGNLEMRGHLETIRTTAERAAGLTRQLLLFSRQQPSQPSVLDLNVVLQRLVKMLRRVLDENIEMRFLPERKIGRVKADSGHVAQVLMNLANNARDAMPGGGKLTIATANATLDENDPRAQPGASAGDYVMLCVSDTGTGMTDEIKARIFEPFFTTKSREKATGLGLATCRTIVRDSGGQIGFESQPGRGTTFKIYFPRAEPSFDVPVRSSASLPLPRGSEALLLVEDDPAVRHLTHDVLQAQGYRVLRASNGLEGLRVARELAGETISLVITDVIMPRMGGKAMAEWLKASRPHLKVLFTSGYPNDAVIGWGMLTTGMEFLPKPYTPATLVRKVREILDAAPAAAPL
jgi:two-component system, cell cycle sensor histidine kinase and response regulator CckA